MKTTLTTILITLIATLLAPMATPTATAQTPATGVAASDTASMAPLELGKYVITMPAGLLQQRQGEAFVKAFLPTGQFGVSIIIEPVMAKEKELKEMCVGMAKELGIPEKAEPIPALKGMKGWYCSGRVEKMIVTVAIVSHDAELLKIVVMESESLRPKGPALLSTLTLR